MNPWVGEVLGVKWLFVVCCPWMHAVNAELEQVRPCQGEPGVNSPSKLMALFGDSLAAFTLQSLMPNFDLLATFFCLFTSLHVLLKVNICIYTVHLAKQPRVDLLTGCQVCKTNPVQLLLKTRQITFFLSLGEFPLYRNSEGRDRINLTYGRKTTHGKCKISPMPQKNHDLGNTGPQLTLFAAITFWQTQMHISDSYQIYCHL